MKSSITFLGGAENVTGSRYLLQTDSQKILIDCGLYQERHLRERNWDSFPIPHGDIDAVLLTHAHLDHCGWIPKLVKEGFKGKIFCTEATAEIAQIVLLDCAHIQVEDAKYKRKRHRRQRRKPPRPVEPLYTVEDAEVCLPMFSTVKYEQTVTITKDIEATFYDAGHILGAASIKITAPCNGNKRTILFSGDIGRPDRPILQNSTTFEEADYVLIESTYGNRVHHSVTDIKDKLADTILATKKAGGNLIVPSFAIERSQEILYHLNELLLEDRIPKLTTFLDSPMAIRVTDVFKKHPELFDDEMVELLNKNESPFDFPGLKMAKTTSQSKSINDAKGTVMIIAGSGMCTGGRIKHHLAAHISKPESTVMFIGYQAVGTLGRIILEGAKKVRILGQEYPVNANIVKINGFSAHADRNELFNWISTLKTTPRCVFVVHGEAESANSFSEFLSKKTGWPTQVPTYGETIDLD